MSNVTVKTLISWLIAEIIWHIIGTLAVPSSQVNVGVLYLQSMEVNEKRLLMLEVTRVTLTDMNILYQRLISLMISIRSRFG